MVSMTALVDWLKCMKVDVACLQETHAPSHESIRKWFANSGFRVVSSSVSNKRCGTAILIKDSLNIKQVIWDDAGRFVQVLVDFGEDQLSFISLYAPNRNPDRNAFFSSLTGLIDLIKPTFVCGDFNSVLNNDRDRLRRASYAGAVVLLLRVPRKVALLCNHYCLIPRPILCGANYIPCKQPIRGRMRRAPLHLALIWSGPLLVSNSLSVSANTIPPFSLIISTCWSSSILPSWMMRIIALLSLLSNLTIHLRHLLPFLIGGTWVNFIFGK